MRVISDKLVFYEIDGDAGISSGRWGDLGGQMSSLIKAAGEWDPSILPPAGEGQPRVGCKNPGPVGFQTQENLSSAGGRRP